MNRKEKRKLKKEINIFEDVVNNTKARGVNRYKASKLCRI